MADHRFLELKQLAEDMASEIENFGSHPEVVEHAQRWADEYRERINIIAGKA